jgi:hypothetical protein
MNQNNLGVLASQAQEFAHSSWNAAGNGVTFAFDIQVTVVPEPSTIALTALGVALLARSWVSKPRMRN